MNVYFDSCVWISALISKDSNHDKALTEIQKIKLNIYNVYISDHLLNEIHDYIKKICIIIQKGKKNTSQVDYKLIVRTMYNDFIAKLLSLPNITFMNPNLSSNMLYQESNLIIKNHIGVIKKDIKCPICKSNYDFWEHDGLYESDIIHALISKELKCGILITFDNDFNTLKTEPNISPLTIQVI